MGIKNNLKIYNFQPTKKYEELQKTYQSLKNTMDPQNSFDFL